MQVPALLYITKGDVTVYEGNITFSGVINFFLEGNNTVKQHLFSCKNFLYGLRDPHHREYLSSQSSHMSFVTYFCSGKLITTNQFLSDKSCNKGKANNSCIFSVIESTVRTCGY